MRICVAALAAVLIGASFGAGAADEALYRREVNEKNPRGKDLVMTVQELRRLKEWKAQDGDIMFLAGFSDSDRVSPKDYFAVEGRDGQGRPAQFMSVEDDGMIFGDEK
jgi:hypothetical protein